MITKITKEQERGLDRIRDEWISRGLSTVQIETRRAHELARAWDEEIMGVHDRPVLHLSSPLGCWIAVCMFHNKQVDSQVDSQVGSQVGSQVYSQVRSQVGSQVGSQVYSQVRSQVDSQVASQVRSQVYSQVASQVRSQVDSQVGSQVYSQVRSQVASQVRSLVWPHFGGHFWAGFYAWVRAMELIGVTKITPKYGPLEACADLGLFYPLENILIISSKPTTLHRNGERLHKDGGAAIEYADGWQLFFLNGVPMEPEQVLTPAERIDPSSVLEEANTDRRRELIRKVGIERMLAKLPHKSLEKRGDYELLSIRLSEEVRDARYLRMINPSVGVWHLEGVDPSCKTITESLNWRNSNWHETAEVLT